MPMSYIMHSLPLNPIEETRFRKLKERTGEDRGLLKKIHHEGMDGLEAKLDKEERKRKGR